ncbi:TBC1 domain family member 31 [Anopheles funestus]|uniref:TBC1 domain family member 31 n=1 Tax=Anopheles funestus TaxID=62324 RepID=UPI0020C695AA|nr:TBC1 domain family member 31 [Anopheles funestus]
MEVNAGTFSKRNGKASFKFNSTNDGVLLHLHHTVRNQSDGTVLRVRFTAAGFSRNNERLIAADHRDNVFVFDLVSQRFWTLPERFTRITVIEGLSGSNLVALGNKEGMVFIVDLGTVTQALEDANNCVRKHNAHPGRIVHLACTPTLRVGTLKSQSKPSSASSTEAFERYDRRYLLAASQDSAKLYSLDDFSELSRISYGLASNNSYRPNAWHWFAGTNGTSLISHSTCGIIRAYRISFKLAKELNVIRLIELYLKNTPPQTITFDRRPVGRGGAALGANSVELTVKRLIEVSPDVAGRCITTAQPTTDGQYYAILYGQSAVTFLALDSWLVCRVVSFPNLFITHFAFVPVENGGESGGATGCGRVRWPTVACALTIRTADNDLMLLKFGSTGTSNPPVLRPLTNRAEHNCYKFRVAPNGRMLANVLSSGEVLLHNLESYQVGHGPDTAPNGQGKRSRTMYVGKTGRPDSASSRSSSSSSRSNGAVMMHSGTGNVGLRAPRKQKLAQQINALHVQLSKTLPKDRLLPILKEYGEYPTKYRTTIWRTLQELPGDGESFGRLLQRGPHPCVASYEQRFAGYDQRTVRNLKKTVSCLAHWCAVFGLIDYMPSFVLPFARQQPNDAHGLFETVATVLVNQCQHWFEFAPLEPFNYLAMVENVLAECEPRLMAFYRRHNVASRTYATPLMETAFARCCSDDAQWLALWDHVLSNESYFLVFLIAAYSSINRGPLMAANGAEVERFFFHPSATLDVRRLVHRAHDLAERCSDATHPRNYFKSFVPLSTTGRMDTLREKTYRQVEKNHVQTVRNRCGPPRTATGKQGVFYNATNNAIDFASLASNSSGRSLLPSPTSSTGGELPDPSDKGSTRTYVSFGNFPKKLTELRCTETTALQTEQRRLEAKIIELEKLEHSLQDRMVNNLIRQEHAQRVKEVERNVEEAIAREEQRVEMQRKLLLLHRKQLRERENELSLDVHNAKLISDATVRERELDALLKKFERERQREETDLLFAEEDIKLKELELLARYTGGPVKAAVAKEMTSDERPLDQRYQVALEQLAVQKLKLYDEIDRTYCSLGMPSGVNEYTYRTVSELRKVASVASSERYPLAKEPAQPPRNRQPVLLDGNSTSQEYVDTIRRMEEQVKILQRLKNDTKRQTNDNQID